MFGIKWLWKTNRGSNIDTSNFVSKEFLSTTLQDYVNRGLLNTTLADYVQTNTLNTTLADYVQTSNLNTTLTNYVSTNTAQTISAQKTFSNGIVSSKIGETIQIRPGKNTSGYISFYNGNTRVGYVGKGNSNSNNLIIGTTEKVVFEATQGIEIPAPTANNNPATKQYVDTKETAINNQINTINNSIAELNDFKNNATGIGLNLRYQDLQLNNSWIGTEVIGQTQVFKFRISTLQETKFMCATLHLKGQANGEEKATHLMFSSATTWGPKIYFNILQIARNDSLTPVWSNTFIRIFYIDTLNSRTQDPYFIDEVINGTI